MPFYTVSWLKQVFCLKMENHHNKLLTYLECFNQDSFVSHDFLGKYFSKILPPYEANIFQCLLTIYLWNAFMPKFFKLESWNFYRVSSPLIKPYIDIYSLGILQFSSKVFKSAPTPKWLPLWNWNVYRRFLSMIEKKCSKI